MSSITVALMIITIIGITGKAMNLQTNKDLTGTPEACPYIENAEYSVTVKGSVSSLNGGCSFIHYNASENLFQSFSLWFGNSPHSGSHCRNNGIEYFLFHCLSKPPSPSADFTNGRMYINKIWLNDEHKKTEDRRCALYEKINNSETVLRVSISKNVSCDGLSDLLYSPHMNPWNDMSSMLIIFKKTRPHVITTTTESIEAISNRYKNGRYILQNYGNRPNPFRRTKQTTEESTSRRQRRHAVQMSDEDGKGGTVMDLSKYNGLQPGVNYNNASTATVNTTDWLLRPQEINNTQLRGSTSSVTPPTKAEVIVLAGANPFALMIANRVHNNNTGSIKPLGLLDQILKLFKN